MTNLPGGVEAIPDPLEEDDGDVAWALATAQAQWSRGARADAVTWLHRAVEAAIGIGQLERAGELELVAEQFARLSRVDAPALGPSGTNGDPIEANHVSTKPPGNAAACIASPSIACGVFRTYPSTA